MSQHEQKETFAHSTTLERICCIVTGDSGAHTDAQSIKLIKDTFIIWHYPNDTVDGRNHSPAGMYKTL